MLWIRKFTARDEQQDERYRTGNGKEGKAGRVDLISRSVRLEKHNEIEKHRADESADLVEHLLNAEALAHALLRGGKGHDGVLRGLLYCLAHALDNEQRTRGDPAVLAHKREQRHGKNIKHVAHDGH